MLGLSLPSGRCLLRYLLVLTVLVAGSIPVGTISAPLPAAFGAPVTLDISRLRPFFDTLAPDEKEEQLRDWALYGVRSVLGLTAPGEMPIRYPALKDNRPGEVSLGRIFSLSATEWGVVMAPELIGNKPLLGGLIDGKYATGNRLPETISLYTYATDPALATIKIAFAGSLKAKELYTPEYGYHSATVSTLADFQDFIAAIDDVVSFKWRAGGIIIGGRKYAKDGRRALTVEDIAGLYQAFNAPGATQSTESEIGFSLDPKMNYLALGEDLKGIEKVPGVAEASADPAFAALLAKQHADFLAIGERLKKSHDLRPFQALQSRYEGGGTPPEARLRALLRYLSERNSYQAARYDGKLQGTSVGMILFYTDLLAKLWLLDYDGVAPSSVVGFRNIRDIKLSKLYWDDFLHRPATRLWFGLRQDGFEFYGNNILFQPVVTRVYAAAYDPAFPGREGHPNYQNREFLGWWDTHYEAMAAAEPYYHKLDQIQKWSCIFMVLQENSAHTLDFLMKYPIRRSIDFEIWNRREATGSKIKIPFIDRRQCGSTSECLPLLASNSFPVMGRPYTISGGVSLVARKDILAKMHKHDPQANRTRVVLPEGQAASAPALASVGSGARASAGPKPTAGAYHPSARGVSPGKRPVNAAPQSAPSTPVTAESAAPTATPVGGGERQVVERDYGAFLVEKEAGAIRMSWTKGPALAPQELVGKLAAWQEATGQSMGGEEIFSGIVDFQDVVRVAVKSVYLVKTATSKDAWIYLAVNPAQVDEYPAKAAADFLAADVFGARLVSDDFARKLAGDKPVVR